jgi:UDP-glucose 4-epimerase
VKVPAKLLRAAAAGSYALRLQPSEPGWLDMGLGVPLMDCARARDELGWAPSRSATETLRELIDGIHDGAELGTPPLERATSGPARIRELLTGLGARP